MMIWPFSQKKPLAKSIFNYFSVLDLAKWPFSQLVYKCSKLQGKVFSHLATLKGVFCWPKKWPNKKTLNLWADGLAKKELTR